MADSADPPTTSAGHYADLASSYGELWDHTPSFREWMVQQILIHADLPSASLIADIGGGTGIFTVELLRQLDRDAMAVVVDPAPEMLAQIPKHAQIHTVCATAEDAATALSQFSSRPANLVLIKEAIHHFPNPGLAVRRLSQVLDSTGFLVVVMLPTHIEYPLFSGALERFTELQPDPGDIADQMSLAGLETTRCTHTFDVAMPKDRWIHMVASRFMSVLSTFSHRELADGLAEVKSALRETQTVRFRDTFEFLIGRPTPSTALE